MNDCTHCEICKRLPFLYSDEYSLRIMAVGISGKERNGQLYKPLDSRTRSGQFLNVMEEIANKNSFSLYRTNLVKCMPVDCKKRIRYPTANEIDFCFNYLNEEINYADPQVIILLGEIVIKAFERNMRIELIRPQNSNLIFTKRGNRFLVTSNHPSYLFRSKERTKMYMKNFENLLVRIKVDIDG